MSVGTLVPLPGTARQAPLAKWEAVLEAAVYSAPSSLSNGASHFLLCLLRCRPAALHQRGQQGLHDLLQAGLL